jgi:sulfofructosephosphate aldolase
MVALDARESMRSIFRDAGRAHDDDDLSDFKRLAAHELGSSASAVLCDPVYGRAAMRVMRQEHPSTGLIVAVDRFEEPRYGPLQESSLDETIMGPLVAEGGISALKLYLFWRPGSGPGFRRDDAKRFVEKCRELGVLSVIEGVVPGNLDASEFDDELVRAAEKMGELGPDVYKTQVPTFGRASDEVIERESRRITEVVGGPWVVLSNGVESNRFTSAVGAACRGGASGMLAGRAVWGKALSASDPAQGLATSGRERLRELVDVIDAHALPWADAVST